MSIPAHVHAELGGGRLFKRGYRLPKDKLLRLKNIVEGFEQFLVQRAVLPLQVQHWNRLHRSGRNGRS